MQNPAPTRSVRGPHLWATLLIGVPVVALLAVPLYARTEPTVLDFPMFYWWTCLWIAALSAGIAGAFRVLARSTSTGEVPTRTEVGR